MAQEFATIHEVIEAAKNRLGPQQWDHLSGGSESETTLLANRAALDAIRFRPRVLRNVRQVSTTSSVLGIPLSIPVLMAPVGSISIAHSEGALASARGAHAFGTAAFVGYRSYPGLEETAAGSKGPLIYQLYVKGDRAWVREEVARVEAAGYAALCVTVDLPRFGRREKNMQSRFQAGYERINRRDLEPDDSEYLATFDWAELAHLRSATRLPLVVKGIQDPHDARMAVEHGVNAIVVSNHGGRQLDYCESTMASLPRVVAAVAGKAEILVDGGFRRGSDVVKAIALGARAVLIGKLLCWALAAGGAARGDRHEHDTARGYRSGAVRARVFDNRVSRRPDLHNHMGGGPSDGLFFNTCSGSWIKRDLWCWSAAY